MIEQGALRAFAVGTFLLALGLAHASAQQPPSIKVVSIERFETLQVTGFREPLVSDKERGGP